MKNNFLTIKLKSLLALILTCILIFAVIAPTVDAALVNSEKNAENEVVTKEADKVIDFSNSKEFDFSKLLTYGDLEEDHYKISKTILRTITRDGKNYTEYEYKITLKNLTAKGIELPYDDADDGEFGLKRDSQGNVVLVPRQTHITIELIGDNKIGDYGISGHYVKGLTITGEGNLDITSKSNGYNVTPGIFIETDDIKSDDEYSGFVIDATVKAESKTYWGIICNGEMQVKAGKTLTAKGVEDKYGSISADRLFKEQGATLNANKIYIYKVTEDTKGVYYSDSNLGNNEGNRKSDDNKTKSAQKVISNPPVILGAEEGKMYCENPVITVKDDEEIDYIKVNGITITKFKYNSYKEKIFEIPTYIDAEKIIVAKDADGNETKLNFTSNNGHIILGGIEIERVHATCTTAGYHKIQYNCKVCNEVVKVENVVDQPLGHSYGNWTYASATKDKHTCTRCGYTETKDSTEKISNTVVTLSSTNYVYDGSEKKPTVTVKDENETLINGKDYTVKYSNNVKAGTATVSVTGKNHYTGTITRNFKIEKKDNSITASNVSVNYSTKAQNVKIGAKQAGDAKLTYSSNNKSITVNSSGVATIKGGFVGKATITITANDTESYKTATKNITVTINKVNNKITASNFTKKYSTKAQTFSIGAKQVGNAKLTYSSNNKNIKVSSNGKVTIAKGYIGKATITITANANGGYNKATKKITVTVNPPSITISKLTNKASKKITINWKKNTAVTGYEIQYSTDKNFKKGVKKVTVKKNGTTSATISKLTKNKKYYVRIRSYKTVSNVKYYSSWTVKNIKIKK